MKAETFFEKFSLLAGAPNAVGRFRELILELAVRGRLSTRAPADGRDPEWRALVDKLEASAAPMDADVPFEIPEGWRWATLEALGDTTPRNTSPDSAECAFVPMTLISEEYGRPARYEVRKWREVKKGYTHVRDGDVVLAKITPCFQNGKSALMKGLPGGIGAGTTELHVFRGDGQAVMPEFVLLFIKSRGFLERGVPRMTGSAGQKRVPHDYFARSPFPVPPPAEQGRIVTRVGSLMALCARLEVHQAERERRHAILSRASLSRFADVPTPANTKFLFHPSFAVDPADLRKSILRLAIEGRLVPRAASDRRVDASFPQLAAVAVEPDDAQFPRHWLRVPLGQVGEWRGGGTPSKSKPEFWKGSIPWVSPKDMKVLRVSDAEDHISSAAVEYSAVRMIPAGSLLMVVRGMILARAFPVALTTAEVTINQDMKALMPFAPETGEFLLLTLRALEPEILAAVQRSTHGTCKLETDVLHGLAVPIPPLAEQRRIVARVDQLMGRVDELEAQLASSKTTAEDLMEAVVAGLIMRS